MRIRQRILHLIERDLPVATALPSVDVLGSSAAATEHLRNGLGRECELTRSGNQHDAANLLAERLDGTMHLERQLRYAVSIRREREPFENDISGTAEGRRKSAAEP